MNRARLATSCLPNGRLPCLLPFAMNQARLATSCLPNGSRRFCSAPSSPVLRSKLFCPSQTLTKVKVDSKIPKSVELLEKGGYIRQAASGIYSFLPLGQMVLERLTFIIDIHMKHIQGQKLQMPALTPASLWQKTNRWETIGKELIRVKDRNNQDYCLGPTHEESFTDLVASVSLSPKALPLRLYQISPKYRDELRPRSALLRCKEFIMKDMYSFDSTTEKAMQSYEVVFQQYLELFKEIQLPVIPVTASAGTMGGNHTHEFQVISEAGEDNVVTCSCGKLACNVEIATRVATTSTKIPLAYILKESIPVSVEGEVPVLSSFKVASHILKWLATLSKEEKNTKPIQMAHYITKTNLYSSKGKKSGEQHQDLFIFHDAKRNMNTTVLPDILGENTLIFPPSYAKENKITITRPTRYFFDHSVHDVCHFPDVAADAISEESEQISEWGNFTEVLPGDVCGEAECKEKGTLHFQKGIEVGQTFFLGDKYSKVMNASIHDFSNALVPLQMGCYGLGVSRIMQAVVEYHHKENAIRWPPTLAPYFVVIIPNSIGLMKDAYDFADAINKWSSACSYKKIVIDDRIKSSVGLRVKDAQLMGISNIIVLGRMWESKGEINLLVNSTTSHFRADKTLEGLKIHFESFQKEVQTLIRKE